MSQLDAADKVTVSNPAGSHPVDPNADVSRTIGKGSTPPGASPLPGATRDVSHLFDGGPGGGPGSGGGLPVRGFDDPGLRDDAHRSGHPRVFVDPLPGTHLIRTNDAYFEAHDKGLAEIVTRGYAGHGGDPRLLSTGADKGLARQASTHTNTRGGATGPGSDWLMGRDSGTTASSGSAGLARGH